MASCVWACMCISVHSKQLPVGSYEEKQVRMNRRWPEFLRGDQGSWEVPSQQGWLPGSDDQPLHRLSTHTSCSGLNPAPVASSENRSDLFEHPELSDICPERVVILVRASFWMTFFARSCSRDFLIRAVQSVAWYLCPCILAFCQKEAEHHS